jgi:hypothetical protein
MRHWIETQIAEGLPAFAGSTISGTVAVKQELLNELLAQWLAATSQQRGAPLDYSRTLSAIKSATVRAEPGTVLVDFTIAV